MPDPQIYTRSNSNGEYVNVEVRPSQQELNEMRDVSGSVSMSASLAGESRRMWRLLYKAVEAFHAGLDVDDLVERPSVQLIDSYGNPLPEPGSDEYEADEAHWEEMCRRAGEEGNTKAADRLADKLMEGPQ